MVNKFTQNVEILCKTIWKSTCKFCANFCVKFYHSFFPVHKIFYSPIFPTYSTSFFTTRRQVEQTNFSTIPQPLLLQLQNIFNRNF